MSGTYVMDIRHFLDESGEIAVAAPKPARQLVSFLGLLIDAVTHETLPAAILSDIRCRQRGCQGLIAVSCEDDPAESICWKCSQCDHHGTISNWAGTKWDNRV